MEFMVQRFFIEYRLPSANEYIDACRRGHHAANQMKKKAEQIIALFIKGARIKPIADYPVHMHYAWTMKNRKMDKSNIAFSKKFIEDALVSCGVLRNDGWREIESFSDTFVTGNPEGVSVEIFYPIIADSDMWRFGKCKPTK